MGKTLTGSTEHKANISMLTPEQQQILNQTLEQLGPAFTENLGQFMQPMDQEQMDAQFQKMYVDPAMMAYDRNIVPGIQQRFTDANAGSSSALNQALAQSATDLSTSLGSAYGQFMQGQQQNQLNALGMFGSMLGQQTFNPIIQQNQGILGPLVGAGGQIGAGYMMSSKTVKENVKPYKSGLAELRDLKVKQYDYIEEVGGDKDRVGFIAEELPEELVAKKNGILHADLYGLIGLAINAIQELDERLTELEGGR